MLKKGFPIQHCETILFPCDFFNSVFTFKALIREMNLDV